MALYDRIVNHELLVRRLNVTVYRVVDESKASVSPAQQLDIITDYTELERLEAAEQAALKREKSMPRTILELKESENNCSLS